MIEDLVHSNDDGVICAELDSDLLAGYIDALLHNREVDDQYADVHRHVSTCTHCTADVNAMIEILRSEEAGELATPQYLPQPDLSFVGVEEPTLTISDRVRRLLDAAKGWVREQEILWVDVSLLLGQSNPLAPARVVRSQHNLATKPLQRISLGTDELGDCDLEITVWESDTVEYHNVVVQVNIPSRWPELSNVAVAAILGEQEWLEQTDAKGRVEFQEIPADQVKQMLFQVTLPGSKT